jgi:hypothetical protein
MVRARATRADAVERVLLLLLALVLPFELTTPVLAIRALAITNVEVVWYLLLLVAAIRWLRTGPPRWSVVHKAIVLWAAVIVLSAMVAPSDRAAACKFALRSLGGCALFFVAADLVTAPGLAARLMVALSLGATVSAGAAVAEIWLPGAADALSAFKTMPTTMGGFLRAGGTFEYPNTGAMYWEATLPVVLTIGAWYARRSRPLPRWVGLAVALVLIAAVVLSASRGGMLTAMLIAVTLAAVPPRVASGLRMPAILVAVALAVLAIGASSLPTLRLQSTDMATWYRAHYRTTAPSLTVSAGQTFASTVTVRNAGLVPWRSGGDHPVTLGYCWFDTSADTTRCPERPRTRLPHDVPPGTDVTLVTEVVAPVRPGAYILQWDMVEEGIAWFSGYGAPTGDVRVDVAPAAGALPPRVTPLGGPPPSILVPIGRIELWRAALRLWAHHPLLGIGPDNFRRAYGRLLELQPYDDRLHANSLYLETLATTGLLGFTALLALMLSLFVTTKNGWRHATSEQRVLALGLALATSAFFVHGVVDYFLPFTPTNGLFWILAGALVGILSAPTPAPDHGPAPGNSEW